MRRLTLLLTLWFCSVFLGSIVLAQDPAPDEIPTPASPPDSAALPQSLFLHPIAPVKATTDLATVLGNDGDFCESPISLDFTNQPVGRVVQNVESYTTSANDPVLSCMWGSPPRPEGYRTVWFKFTAPNNGLVTINTDTSNYDTVLGIFAGPNDSSACGFLTPVACNDDYTGFTSKETFAIFQGQTYYIVVADWNAASAGQQTLNIFIEPQPIESLWSLVGNESGAQRTHHATVVDGGYIYALGGQTNVLGAPNRSNKLFRYQTWTGSWQELASIAPLPAGGGLSDLTAVFLNGKIYVPGGDVGAPDGFHGTHFVYDAQFNFWSTAAAVPGTPVGWAQAVAAADQSGYYLTGGISSKPVFSTTATVHNTVWFFNAGSGSWSARPAMNTARYGHTAVRLGDRICVVGGINATNLLGGGECLTPFAPGWEEIGSLNIPRYGAGSAVGPDGRWYVFGGTTIDSQGNHVPVATTEVYDPQSPGSGWSFMGVRFDLVDPDTVLARAYPRGEFAGEYLYAIGGNHANPSLNNYEVVPLVQRLKISPVTIYLPLVRSSGVEDFDDNMAAAKGLPLNYWAAGSFNQSTDFYDFYFVDLPTAGGVSVRLNNIPGDSNYDIYVFDSNKLLWGESTNLGNQAESVDLTLPAGRYYVLVQRLVGQPEGSHYSVAVLR